MEMEEEEIQAQKAQASLLEAEGKVINRLIIIASFSIRNFSD